MRDRRPLTTALSHPTPPRARRSLVKALARSSQGVVRMLLLVTLGSLSGTGCLIAESPSYGEPRRTAPVIDDLSVFPQPTSVIKLTSAEKDLSFSMTVRSEDAGEDVLGVLVLDYKVMDPKREQSLGVCAQLPSRAADQPKPLTCTYTPDGRLERGCHSLTLFVGHASSFNLTKGVPIPEVSDDDIAAITWFIQVDFGDNPPWECPTVT